jgi:Protein of unknown function (DUF3179)
VKKSNCLFVSLVLAVMPCGSVVAALPQEDNPPANGIIAKPDLFEPLTEPPCSYCITQHRKGFVKDDDMVVAWIRGAHNGGAIPVRHFLSSPRVINDTYGLFFYDPDGGYVAAFEKDYGYRFYGWRNGVMVVEGKDGTLWSALSGRAISGPQEGKRLVRVPSLTTTWSNWLLLHPESTAYDMFDGRKYPAAKLPVEMTADASASMGKVDERLGRMDPVIGLEGAESQLSISLSGLADRACFRDVLDDKPVVVFWFAPTNTASAFESTVDGQALTFYADGISPDTAPFKDRETGTRWTIAGRAVDGPLRGKELTWVPSIQCRWYAWSAEYPQTRLRQADNPAGDPK